MSHVHDITDHTIVARRAINLSLAVAVVMLVGKLSAYYLTGSTAILSDAAESVVHMGATAIAAFSLWYARRQATKDYPYGFGKIAYFSSGFEGALIMVAAVTIIYQGIVSLISGPQIQRLGIGLLITGALGLVNLVLGLYLIRVGKKHNEVILISNGQHILTDMWTSVAVVVGITVVWLTDWVVLDPIVAILAGLQILYTALSLINVSYAGLMDRADPDDTGKLIDELDLAVSGGEIFGYHELRHRRVNDVLRVEVHFLMPRLLSIGEAHAAASAVEQKIEDRFDGPVTVISHLEPDDHERSHPDGHPASSDPLSS